MQIIIVVGARPNFMKIAPVISAIGKHNAVTDHMQIEYRLVHTGQHYDYEMSQVFFEDLRLPEPDIHLGLGGGTQTEQTAKIMLRLEEVFLDNRPELVMVVGDVNSTLAGALVAAKMRIPLAHVEAGLRSYDRDMPEEINRLLTDAVSDYLFTHSRNADENLKKEGVSGDKIFLVGNVMVDSLLASRPRADKSPVLARLGLQRNEYAALTLHRPANVDKKEKLAAIIEAVREVAVKIPIVFPIHPRTRKNIEAFGLNGLTRSAGISFIEPLGYTDFLKLEMDARFVMTDSGGIQEETTALGIPCLTLRDSTERPVTVSEGTNILVSDDRDKLINEAIKILDGKGKKGTIPYLWDGKAAERIIGILSRGGTYN
jgi:UDP-N-acetylglucosamine 2-epimerase (non-hydrolysing)